MSFVLSQHKIYCIAPFRLRAIQFIGPKFDFPFVLLCIDIISKSWLNITIFKSRKSFYAHTAVEVVG
jgi:hypothetical protein